MSITTSHRLNGTLVARTPLHVGGAGAGLFADAALATDGQGRYLIPGTSLTGVLRQRLVVDGYLTDAQAERWFGFARKDTGAASYVWVDDAVAPATATHYVRDMVGIDRYTGAAATGVLYAFEMMPAGTQFEADITVEQPPEWDPEKFGPSAEQLTADIAALLTNGLQVGAKTGTGHGEVFWRDPRWRVLNLETPDGLLAALGGGTPVAHKDRPASPARTNPWSLTVTVPWRPIGGLLVSEQWDNHDADRAPLTEVVPALDGDNGDYSAFVLPGSSVRGVLRSHAEKIVRTVWDGAPAVDADSAFLDQVAVGGFEPLLDLFGTAGTSGRESNDTRSGARRGAVRVSSVRTQPFPSALWGAVAQAKKSPEKDREAAVFAATAISQFNQDTRVKDTGLWCDFATRNSIDRWTGGTVDGLLFSAIEIYTTRFTTWDRLQIEVDFRRLSPTAGAAPAPRAAAEQRIRAASALLLLVLRDLAEGQLRFGHGTTRGLGEIETEVDNVEVSLGEKLAALTSTGQESVSRTLTGFGAAFATLAPGLSQAWAESLAAPIQRPSDSLTRS